MSKRAYRFSNCILPKAKKLCSSNSIYDQSEQKEQTSLTQTSLTSELISENDVILSSQVIPPSILAKQPKPYKPFWTSHLDDFSDIDEYN